MEEAHICEERGYPRPVTEVHRGFRPGASLHDVVTTISAAARARAAAGLSTYCVTLDLEKAFDLVNWQIMRHTLEAVGFDGKALSTFLSLYKGGSVIIHLGGLQGKRITPTVGTRQYVNGATL